MTTSFSTQTFERYIISLVAFISSGILITLGILGPLFLDIIEYKTSPSGIYQTMGQDIINLAVLSPILLVAGYLHLRKDRRSKYLLILTPLYLIYMALSYGIGMEWSNSAYTGNTEQYFYFYLTLVISGLILLLGSLSLFNESDSPEFKKSQLRIYIPILATALVVFFFMWLGDVNEVIRNGDTPSGAYSAAPTVFWLIRFFDLGFSIPLGFISIYLLITRPMKAYPLLQLFFGFFITMILAVNSMGYVMYLSNDPELQIEGLVIFGILALLSFAGYYFLVKDKIKRKN